MFLVHFFPVYSLWLKGNGRKGKGRRRGGRKGEKGGMGGRGVEGGDKHQTVFYPKLHFTQAMNNEVTIVLNSFTLTDCKDDRNLRLMNPCRCSSFETKMDIIQEKWLLKDSACFGFFSPPKDEMFILTRHQNISWSQGQIGEESRGRSRSSLPSNSSASFSIAVILHPLLSERMVSLVTKSWYFHVGWWDFCFPNSTLTTTRGTCWIYGFPVPPQTYWARISREES